MKEGNKDPRLVWYWQKRIGRRESSRKWRGTVFTSLPQTTGLGGKELGKKLSSELEVGKAWAGSCGQTGDHRVLEKADGAPPRTVDPRVYPLGQMRGKAGGAPPRTVDPTVYRIGQMNRIFFLKFLLHFRRVDVVVNIIW